MDNTVEVRYAGVVVGRGALKELPDAAAVFVGIAEPLPVGTLVTLKIGDAVREARVDDVVESAEPAAAGMRVRWGAAPAVRSAPAAAPAPAEAAREVAPDSGPTPASVAAGDNGPTVAAEAGDEGSGALLADEGSGALPAPLSLASPSGDGAHSGGGKKRRKRR